MGKKAVTERPEVRPRRPDRPGYVESDKSYLDNNVDLAVALLEEEEKALKDPAWAAQAFYLRGVEFGLAAVERLARKAMKRHPKLEEFTMAMGAWFFSVPDRRRTVGADEADEFPGMLKLREFLEEWDDVLKLTGTPMRFTADGPVVRDW